MSGVEALALFAVGLALVVLWQWRSGLIAARKATLEEALSSRDRTRVLAALDEVRRVGLNDHAEAVLTLVATEPPEDVEKAVVRLVAGQQWEPMESDAARRLRAWAAAQPVPAPDPREEPGSDDLLSRVEHALGRRVRWLSTSRDGETVTIDRDEPGPGPEEAGPWG